MKMRMTIRNRYLRFLLPVFIGLLLLALVALWVGDFGIRFQFGKPTPLKELSPDELPGAYVTLPVAESGESFTQRGYETADGQKVIAEQYCVCQVQGKYLTIKVSQKDLPKINKYMKAQESVQKGELGSILEVNLGDFTGTVNSLDKAVNEQLRTWFVNHQIDAEEMLDEMSGADISGYPGVENKDYTAYFDDVILPLELDVGYLGVRSAGFVKTMTAVAAVLVLLGKGYQFSGIRRKKSISCHMPLSSTMMVLHAVRSSSSARCSGVMSSQPSSCSTKISRPGTGSSSSMPSSVWRMRMRRSGGRLGSEMRLWM